MGRSCARECGARLEFCLTRWHHRTTREGLWMERDGLIHFAHPRGPRRVDWAAIDAGRGRPRRWCGAVPLWPALTSGEWSLSDERCDRHRRLVVACRVVGSRQSRQLSVLDEDILAGAICGRPNKVI